MQKFHERKIFHALFYRADGAFRRSHEIVLSAFTVPLLPGRQIQQEIATGLVRRINIPGLRIQRMFSWALTSGELGGLPGEFYQFANSIRSELSTVSVRLLKEAV